MPDSLSRRARDLYANAIVWDAHSGFMPDPKANLANLERWRAAGVSYLSIDIGFDLLPWEQTVRTLAAFRHWILQHADEFVLARTARDIRHAQSAGKMALTFDIEGMNALDGRLEMVELYHALGVRQILFAFNRNNAAGGGCHDEDAGLTDFGRSVIREMNRLGMFVDVSHCGYRTSMEAMERSSQPVIFSHSNPRALCRHERNISDAQIKACAATGGVVGVVGVSLFLENADVSAGSLADNVEYLLNVAGPDHVGIGLDYAFPVDIGEMDDIIRANPQFWPVERGYSDPHIAHVAPSQLLELTEILLRRGYSADVVRGVLGENFLRLAARVWGDPDRS
jgi:membrane dipeptidase